MRSALALVMLTALGRAAAAQDAFEIQVYDSETTPAGHAGLEAHLNNAVSGVTAAPPGELASDRVTHLTLEPHIGLAWWCEAGAYFQTALRPDGSFQYAGVKLRLKMRLRRRWHDRLGLAINFELSSVPRGYEPNELGVELRPVIDVRYQRLYASLNPIIGFDLRGPQQGRPQLEPAATVLVHLFGPLEAGVEYYAAFGPVSQFAAPASQVHRLFVVADVAFRRWGLQLGGGYGLAAGDRWIVKAIASVELTPP